MDWALPQMCQTILSDSIFLVNTHISPVLDDPFPYCHKHYCLSKKQSFSSCRSSIYRKNKDKKKRERWHYLGCVSKVHNFSYSSFFFFNKINILFHGGRKPLESSAYFLYKCGLSCRARCSDWTLPDNKSLGNQFQCCISLKTIWSYCCKLLFCEMYFQLNMGTHKYTFSCGKGNKLYPLFKTNQHRAANGKTL